MDKVYNNISKHFDHTRFSVWKGVAEFLDSIESKSIIADVGCGNGKNSRYRKDIYTICCDISIELLKITLSKQDDFKYDCILANGISLPYKSETFDYTISIAVLHHINSFQDRIKFILELLRITRKKGKVLFTVWADEQQKKQKWKLISGTDYLIPWDDRNGNIIDRYYHLFSKNELENIMDIINREYTYCKYTLNYEFDNWFVICYL